MDLTLLEGPDGILLVHLARAPAAIPDAADVRRVGRAAVVTGNLSRELVAALRHHGCGAAQPEDVHCLLEAQDRL